MSAVRSVQVLQRRAAAEWQAMRAVDRARSHTTARRFLLQAAGLFPDRAVPNALNAADALWPLGTGTYEGAYACLPGDGGSDGSAGSGSPGAGAGAKAGAAVVWACADAHGRLLFLWAIRRARDPSRAPRGNPVSGLRWVLPGLHSSCLRHLGPQWRQDFVGVLHRVTGAGAGTGWRQPPRARPWFWSG